MNDSLRSWTVLAFLSLAAAAALAAHRLEEAALVLPLDSIGREIDGWHAARDETAGERLLSRLSPTAWLARNYEKDGRRIGLFIAYYGRQRSGETLHSPKRCLPGAGWTIRRTGTALVPLRNGTASINDYVVENAGRQAAALYWYQSGGRVIASEYVGKLALLRDALVEGRQSAALVRITFDRAQVSTDEGIRFAERMIPRIERCFMGEHTW